MIALILIFSSVILSLPLNAVAETVANRTFFQAGGNIYSIKAGYIGMPTVVFNPVAASDLFEQLPLKAPQGKSLLVTDLYLETDPPSGNPLLMILFAESPENTITTLRTLHIREPTHNYVSMNSPIVIPSGWLLHVAF